MKAGAEFHEVVMHLNGGCTRVLIEGPFDLGKRIASCDLLAEGGCHWDLPTQKIPAHLRALGSRFVVHYRAARPEEQDSADRIRAAVYDFVVEDI